MLIVGLILGLATMATAQPTNDLGLPKAPKIEPPKPAAGDPLPEANAATEQAALLNRLTTHTLHPPEPGQDAKAARAQLDELITDASRLTRITEPGPLRLTAMTLQMQGLHLHLSRWPDDPQAGELLWLLKLKAEQTKELQIPDAAAIGDFWLMSAELFELQRGQDPPAKRLEKTQAALSAYQAKYPKSAPVQAVEAMLAALNTKKTAATPPTKTPAPNVEPAWKLGALKIDSGVVTYPLTSPFQPDGQIVRLLTPDVPPDADQEIKFLYVMPAEPGQGREFGDPLAIIRDLNLHNTLNMVVVAPTIAQVPWGADHPSNPAIRQESFLVQAVVPAVDSIFPSTRARRSLIGFGSGGWGVVSLLLRYPAVFDAAASWDAPLMVDSPERFGMAQVFGNDAQVFKRYDLREQLRAQSAVLVDRKRLAILGYDLFRADLQKTHELLDELNIPHDYADGPRTELGWRGPWMQGAIQALDAMLR